MSMVVDADRLLGLAHIGDGRAELLDETAAALVVLLAWHGHPTGAQPVRAALGGVSAWVRSYASSLRRRAEILERGLVVDESPTSRVPVGGAVGGAGEVGATRRKRGEIGRRTARTMLDLLEGPEPRALRRLLASLYQLDDAGAVAFCNELGPDGVGTLPLALVDIGIAPGELRRHLAPMADALGRASTVEGEDGLWFTGTDLMTGHEESVIAPTAYLDFARFDSAFVVDAATAFLAPFGDSELALRGVVYPITGGRFTDADTRMPILRHVLDGDNIERRRFLEGLEEAGVVASLTSPATRWLDGGATVAALLGSDEPSTGERLPSS